MNPKHMMVAIPVDVYAKAQQLRATLTELVAEGDRLKAASHAAWDEHKPMLDALRKHPSEETAKAYLESLDACQSDKGLLLRIDCDTRRIQCMKDLDDLNQQILTVLGIAIVEDDDRSL